MRRAPVTVRHITARRLAFAATAATVLFTTVFTAAAATFASTVTGAAIRRSLSASPGSTITVTAPTTAAGAARASETVSSEIRKGLPGLPFAMSESLRSDILDLPAAGPAGHHAQTQIISLADLRAHTVQVSGTCPGAHGPAGVVPVCVPAAAARLLRLAPGDTLSLRDSVTGARVQVRVTGVFRPLGPASQYWSVDPLGRSAVQRSGGFTVYGPLVTSQAAAASGAVPVSSGAWLVLPDFSRLNSPNLATLGNKLSAALGSLSGSAQLPSAVPTTGLPAELANLATALLVARSQLLIGVLILLVIAGAALAVAVRLLAVRREPEVALLAARGASRRQLAARGVTEAALLAIPAFVLGPLLGGALVPLMTGTGPLAAAKLRLAPGQPATAWLAAGAVAAGCAVIIALPWLRTPPSPIRQRVSSGRQRAVTASLSSGADIALVALAIVAGWQLAHYAAPVAVGVDGALGVDPILVGAPVLAIAAGTVVMLRLLPLATRLGERAAARGRGLVLAVAAWQMSRRPLRQAGPALLAVLAVTTAVITLSDVTSWQRSVTAQARFAVGADERVTLPPAAPLAIGQVADVTAAPGVQASTPAVHAVLGVGQGGNATLLAVNGQQAAKIMPVGESGTGSAAALLRRIGRQAPAGGVAIPGHPARLSVTATLTRAPVTGPELAIQLTDAAGIGYQVPIGALPADGRSHRMTVTIAPGRRADYPLRLDGFSLQYSMPRAHSATATLTVESVSAADSGRFGPPIALAPGAGHRMLALAVAQQSAGVRAPPSAASPLLRNGRLSTRFGTGNGSNIDGRIPASLTVTATSRITVLPGLATAGFLAANDQRLGDTVAASMDGTPVRVRLDGVIRRFPTLTGSGGVIVDQAALQDLLLASGSAPAAVTEWWLRTSGHAVLTGLPSGTSVSSSAAVASALRAAPLSSAPLQALLAIALAALILAAAGFAVSVATARERERDASLLDALGARPGQVVGLLCLEQAMLAVPAAAAGLLLGFLLSRLIIPAVSLTAQATRPIPPVSVQVPWAAAAGVAVLIAALPAAATALGALRRGGTAARLRAEEET
jgi:FtsX-like permease family